MYRLFKKYGKHIMAIFSAVLMIAFALPTFRNFGGGNANARVAGTVNGEKIYQPDIARARQAWQVLTHTPAGPEGRAIVDMWLPPAAVGQISRRPILFYLLQKEAQEMGASVSMDMLNSVIANNPMFNTGNSEHDDELKAAMAQLLLVSNGASRAASPIKISEPLREHRLAELLQSIRVTAADFTAAQYATKVPPPTADQLKAQFEKYAGLIKGAAYGDNPFGFGYKYPDRIKLQYIAVPQAAVRDFVEHFNAPGKTKDDYEWEVDAQKYYRQHQYEFPTTAPAEPKKDSAFSLDAPTGKPTTKPYAEVKSDIRKRLIDDATAKRVVQIQDHINGVLAKDWVAYHAAANGATRPTTVPASSLGVPYDSVEPFAESRGGGSGCVRRATHDQIDRRHVADRGRFIQAARHRRCHDQRHEPSAESAIVFDDIQRCVCAGRESQRQQRASGDATVAAVGGHEQHDLHRAHNGRRAVA